MLESSIIRIQRGIIKTYTYLELVDMGKISDDNPGKLVSAASRKRGG